MSRLNFLAEILSPSATKKFGAKGVGFVLALLIGAFVAALAFASCEGDADLNTDGDGTQDLSEETESPPGIVYPPDDGGNTPSGNPTVVSSIDLSLSEVPMTSGSSVFNLGDVILLTDSQVSSQFTTTFPTGRNAEFSLEGEKVKVKVNGAGTYLINKGAVPSASVTGTYPNTFIKISNGGSFLWIKAAQGDQIRATLKI